MTQPFQLRINQAIVSLIAIALGNLVLQPSARADDWRHREDQPLTMMAPNPRRKITMPQSPPLLHQRLARMQVVRQIQSSGQIWISSELADQKRDIYQEALALTWQDFWQVSEQSIDQFNQLLQANYANQTMLSDRACGVAAGAPAVIAV
jgi:hypothetical protein